MLSCELQWILNASPKSTEVVALMYTPVSEAISKTMHIYIYTLADPFVWYVPVHHTDTLSHWREILLGVGLVFHRKTIPMPHGCTV